MSSASSIEFDPSALPAARSVAHHSRPAVRTIQVGLLGLGNVGQAVARLAAGVTPLSERGWRFQVAGALVRDTRRARDCPLPARLTTDAAAFLRGSYDVVIEALGTIEPARTLIARLLGRGIPVVTANKALVAAEGASLAALAARRGTSLRYEASALAGVPFLGALDARPLVSDLHHCVGVVNGTSNFILSRLAADGASFADALAAAQALGMTEPDPSRDLDGLDACDKLMLLASIFGWGRFPPDAVDVCGIRDVTGRDSAAARTVGCTIKPLVCASRDGATVSGFIGPTLVPLDHPLAALTGTLSGIQLSGRFISDLCFSGPGAGPDITAATLLDDAVESLSSAPTRLRLPRVPAEPLAAAPAVTEWFVRAQFPGFVPDPATVRSVLSGFGVAVQHVTGAEDEACWLLLAPASRQQIVEVEAALRETHRIRCVSFRAIGGACAWSMTRA